MRQSAEDYLETILLLSREKERVRAVDVAAVLGVTKPSVSVAVKQLRERGYLIVDEGGIRLTETGGAEAKKVLDRHELLTRYFVGLGVPREIAQIDACKVEHVLSAETYRYLEAHIRKEKW